MSRQGRPGRYSAELRERAIRLVREGEAAYGSEWEAICAMAEMLGWTAEDRTGPHPRPPGAAFDDLELATLDRFGGHLILA